MKTHSFVTITTLCLSLSLLSGCDKTDNGNSHEKETRDYEDDCATDGCPEAACLLSGYCQEYCLELGGEWNYFVECCKFEGEDGWSLCDEDVPDDTLDDCATDECAASACLLQGDCEEYCLELSGGWNHTDNCCELEEGHEYSEKFFTCRFIPDDTTDDTIGDTTDDTIGDTQDDTIGDTTDDTIGDTTDDTIGDTQDDCATDGCAEAACALQGDCEEYCLELGGGWNHTDNCCVFPSPKHNDERFACSAG